MIKTIESELQSRLARIFGMKLVTLDAPAPDALEQDKLFIEVTEVKNSFKDGQHFAKVTGHIFIYSQSNKLPLGSMAKKISSADAADTMPFFFYEFEENVRRFQNIVGRSVNFVFFFNDQYDPKVGTMNQINMQVSE